MKKYLYNILTLGFLLTTISCGIYSFGGVTLDERVKTVQIDFFRNEATLVEPTLSNRFTLALQDLFDSQTNLESVRTGGDIVLEGEIVDYRINPMTATAQQTAAQNRLTIGINVRYFNKYEPDNEFEQKFSFYHDFPANSQLVGGVLDSALEEILERVTQDIFNASVAQW